MCVIITKELTLSDTRWPDVRHFFAGGLGGSVQEEEVDVIKPDDDDVLFVPTLRASGRPGPPRLLRTTAEATGVTVTGDPVLLLHP